MIYASARKDFEDVNEFAPALVTRYGGLPIGTAALPGGDVVGGMFVKTVQVHGYNSTFKNCADAYRSNAEVMREEHFPGETPAGFFWPGLGENPLESLLFHRAQHMADLSASFLASFVAKLPNPVIIAHSLGCRVTLEAVSKHGMKAKALVLLGAAVDDDSLSTIYANVSTNVEKVLVFWSQRDKVLCDAFKFDQLFKKALGCRGPRVSLPWVESHEVTATVPAHSDYRLDRGIWREVAKLF